MEEKKFYNKEWKEIKRQRCQVYTRVMGYLRPVSHYNIWKKTEFYSRKWFRPDCECTRNFDIKNDTTEINKQFIEWYANKLLQLEINTI